MSNSVSGSLFGVSVDLCVYVCGMFICGDREDLGGEQSTPGGR